jgi:peptide/nickel transport system permease protein
VSAVAGYSPEVRPAAGARRAARRSWHPTAIVGLGLFVFIAGVTVCAPLLARYDPTDQVLRDAFAAPSAAHWLGTDRLGRDLFARIAYGGRFPLAVTLVAVSVSAIFGTLLGAVVGRVGGAVEEIAMRLIDVFLSFPSVLVGFVIAALLKPGFGTLVLALTITDWTPFARLARAITLELNTRAYIEAAFAVGAPEPVIIRKHVLHHLAGPVLAMGFLRFGHGLLTIAGLSYLGLGAPPPAPDWGAMLAEAQPYMVRFPVLVLAPGLVIFATALGVALAGRGLMLMADAPHGGSRA